MHHRIKLMLREQPRKRRGIPHVGVGQCHGFAGQFLQPIHDRAARVLKIIKNGDIIARVDQRDVGMRPDVARAPGQKNMLCHSSVILIDQSSHRYRPPIATERVLPSKAKAVFPRVQRSLPRIRANRSLDRRSLKGLARYLHPLGFRHQGVDLAQMLGQADLVEIIVLHHMPPRRRAKMGVAAGPFQNVDDLAGDVLRIEEIRQQAGLAVLDRLAHRRHVRGHDRGAHRHGLKAGPRQDERH
mmetsp:Transcript_3083/g.5276  ORF Transcript_3083/g.5276 Transcript_3083/m.5276 type:complete len:242 (-) Transcript_3083:427-1152(-)